MRHVIILLLLAALSPAANAQVDWGNVVINPGIKIGGSTGSNGGFTYGFELSVTYLTNNGPLYYGVVLDWDNINQGRKKIHIGAEIGLPFVGVEFGPTFAYGIGEPESGYSITPYAGAIIHYYHSFVFLPGETFHENGAYLKLPFRADGSALLDLH